MNVFLPPLYDELVERLALGLEPLDALAAGRIARPLDVVVEGAIVGPTRLERHASGRFVLVYERGVETPVLVRLVPGDRRYVPRRMQFDITALADVLDAEQAGTDVPTGSRTWRPLLFPGAGYDLGSAATAVRGTVTAGGKPVRWTRVEATAGGQRVGLAHGDDRGEFLLVLGFQKGAVGDLVSPLAVTIDVYAADPAAAVDPDDPLADLPLEEAAAPGVLPDDVSDAVDPPGGYAQIAHLPDTPIPLGRATSVPVVT